MFVLYCPVTKETGISLARDLNCESGKVPPEDVIDILIRWGSSARIRHIPTTVLNKKRVVLKLTNKMETMEILSSRGISIPPLDVHPPCIGRSTYHTQGQGLWFCWEENQIESARREGADYFIKYIPPCQEWRVHVIGGEAVFVQNKYPTNRISTAFMGIQGFQNRWHERMVDISSAPEEVINQAVAAVNILGADFGGVDVLWGIDGRPYVLEINSGPALPTPETRAPYISYFRRFFSRE